MRPRLRHSILIAGACLLGTGSPTLAADSTHSVDRNRYLAPHAAIAPVIDGIADELVWEQAEWYPIADRWLGPEYTSEDFSGRFKVAWTEQRIYILVEVVDDILFDSHRDPLV